MKVQRKAVFETNSSSSHSVTIADSGELLDTLKVDTNGTVHLETGEYGWEVEDYYHPFDRASYAATFAANSSSEQYIQMLYDVIKEHTCCRNVIINGKKDARNEIDYGYIDHQSWDEAARIFESKESLKNFLFNPRSSFRTDNDNS